MDQNPQPSQRFQVGYPSSTFGARATHWNWTGQGELTLEGEQVLLTGKRRRSFWFAADQSVSIGKDQIRDVSQAGAVLTCTVDLEGRTPEPLTLRFSTEAEAGRVAREFPTTRSEAHQESEAFARQLAASGTRVVVTPALVAACVVLFVIMVATGVPILSPVGPEMIPWGTNYGPLTLNGELWRLVTAMFLHFGALHLALNMWVLWSMGPQIERLLGNARFAVLYLCSGLAGGIASLLWNPVVNSAGASGAIFGVIGAWLALTLNPATHIPRTVAKSQRNSAIAFVAYNVMNGLVHQGIDNAAHVGGLVGGFAIGWLLARPVGAPKPPAPDVQLMGTTAGAAVVLAALGWWLLHPSPEAAARRDFPVTLNQFADWEDKAVKLQQSLFQDLESKRISEREWARQMKSEVEPLWDSANTAAQRLTPGEDASRSAATQALQKYVQLRVDWVRLASEGVLQQDETTIHRAAEVDTEVATALVKVQEAFKKLKLYSLPSARSNSGAIFGLSTSLQMGKLR